MACCPSPRGVRGVDSDGCKSLISLRLFNYPGSEPRGVGPRIRSNTRIFDGSFVLTLESLALSR